MKIRTIEIEEGKSYSFVIGTREPLLPTERDAIREQVNEAMSNFERWDIAKHGVAFLETYGEPEGEPLGEKNEGLKPGSQYLIFALLSAGEGGEKPGPDRIREQARELGETIAGTINSERLRFSVIVLYDSSLQVIPVNPENLARGIRYV